MTARPLALRPYSVSGCPGSDRVHHNRQLAARRPGALREAEDALRMCAAQCADNVRATASPDLRQEYRIRMVGHEDCADVIAALRARREEGK